MLLPKPYPGEVLIAIWPSAHDPMDGAIKFLTRGRGTHASFVRGNDKIIENFYPRVRERSWLPSEEQKVELYRIAGSGPHDWHNLEKWFDRQLEHPVAYSIRDLFRYALDMAPVKGRSCFCSQWVLRGCRLNLQAAQQPLARLRYEDFAPPSQLRSSPRLLPVALRMVSREEHYGGKHHRSHIG